MKLIEIWRYPVKSMMGESIASAEITPQGLLGDRAWATRDELRGGIRGAKKIGSLMKLAAAYRDGAGSEVVITLPDGSTVATGSPERDTAVSAALEHEVTLWPLQPADDLDHYRRGASDSDDLMEELRDIFGRDPDEPLPDLSVFPPEIIEFESPPGTYLDAYPLLVMTTAAMSALAEALPESVINVRRFRPNLIVDTGDLVGHPELGWAGRHLRVGEVELELVTGCPRCVMPTREVTPEIPADRAVLRHIVADLDQNLGVYANVITPGVVSLDDPVELL